MRFLTLYTPAHPLEGQRTPESMARMGTFVEASVKSGVLLATGSIVPSAINGVRMRLASGKFGVETAPSVPDCRQTGGWAILNVNSPEHLQEVARQFLEVAGDGDVEVVEIMQMPMP
jgi:hypothetical protein